TNEIARNDIHDNNLGIGATSSNSNLIYNNVFIDNGNHATDDGANFWNATYPTGGNFWAGFGGMDVFRGPGQDLEGPDGIFDTLRNVTGVIDHYPWTHRLCSHPQVISTTPGPDGIDIPRNVNVVIRFSREMNTTSVEESVLFTPARTITGFSWNTANTTVTISTSLFAYGSTHTVTLRGNTTFDIHGIPIYSLQGNTPQGNHVWSFTIMPAPVPPTMEPLSNYTASMSFNINYTSTDPRGVDHVTLYYRLAGVDAWTTFGVFYSSPILFTAPGDGEYQFYLMAMNTLGQSTPAPHQYTIPMGSTIVDVTAPVVDAGSNEIRNAQFSSTSGRTSIANASDAMSGIDAITWSGPAQVQFGTPNNLTTTISATANGVYLITIRVVDMAGNVAESNFTLTWDVTPPVVNAGSDEIRNTAFHTGAGRTAIASASDPNSGIIS
ncbi:MAG: NosD domain-containing protein, partial [Candidatus Thermoplasmatota archaeon]|nr:NosD domain-containing protein [Candidatus Thermoplasmatota archaeon]